MIRSLSMAVLIILFAFGMISCSSKTYKYHYEEYGLIEGITGLSKGVIRVDTILAKNDHAAFITATEKFCIVLHSYKKMSENTGTISQLPLTFELKKIQKSGLGKKIYYPINITDSLCDQVNKRLK